MFFVDILGIKAFLPGGLAAANKIIDFDEYIGKDVTVMIENYLKDTNIFIVSNKKYVKYILPKKIKELDKSKKYKGNVTGTTKYGIFIEWDDSSGDDFKYTGLLHHTKMKEQTKTRFQQNDFKPGDEIDFWVDKITDDNRIILSEDDPDEYMEQINKFKEKYLNLAITGEVVSIKPFGIILKLEENIIGMIPKKELKKQKKIYKIGEKINVIVDDIQNEKIFLRLINEE